MDEEQAKRLMEAQKDTEWIKKIRMAQTADELVGLYEEKGIALKEEMSVYPIRNQTKALDDEELDEVAGGWLDGSCPRKYTLLCLVCSQFKSWGCGNGYWDSENTSNNYKSYSP